MAYVPAPTKHTQLQMTDDYKKFVTYASMFDTGLGVAVDLSKEYKCQYCGRVWYVNELFRTSCATCGAPKGN